MTKIFMGIVLGSLALSANSFAANKKADKKIDVMQICGTIVRQDTPWDGEQVELLKKDDKGELVSSYYLVEVVPGTLSYFQKDQPEDFCAVGIPSQAQMTDSSPQFFVFEVFEE